MIVLVLGGTRSGKSAVAEEVASRLAGPRSAVTYVATARVDPADADHVARIDAHRARRPTAWTTVECAHDGLPDVLATSAGCVLVDSLGTWVAAHPGLDPDIDALIAALRRRQEPTVLVSEEVGLSLHAPTDLGRRFVDALGATNRSVSLVAGEVLFVVAGRALRLPPPGDLPC